MCPATACPPRASRKATPKKIDRLLSRRKRRNFAALVVAEPDDDEVGKPGRDPADVDDEHRAQDHGPRACRRVPLSSGPALEVGDLLGLVLDLLLGPAQLVLRLALLLFLAPLVAQSGIVGNVAGRLLGASGDLVDDAHFHS